MSSSEKAASPKKGNADIAHLLAPYKSIALVLQGGGALGSYQAGVFEALSEAGIQPTWVSGVSIGAINAAIISGNKPQNQVARLREFWETVTDHGYAAHLSGAETLRQLHNMTSAWMTMTSGIPGFFTPRTMNPWLQIPGNSGSTSFYDTQNLRSTLEYLIDWDMLNDQTHRLSVGAVDVELGNFRFFDSFIERLAPEHVMASGALPPAFPAVEIEGRSYWDGGIVSNTPLQYLLESQKLVDTLVFQVDLFNARGKIPQSMAEVNARQKDIMYSSRTRNATDRFKKIHNLEIELSHALKRIPKDKLTDEDHALLKTLDEKSQINVLHLIYHQHEYEGDSKDYEFSKLTMQEHWNAGLEDTRRTLGHHEWLKLPHEKIGMTVHDVHQDFETEPRKKPNR
jgi:NTE family protein